MFVVRAVVGGPEVLSPEHYFEARIYHNKITFLFTTFDLVGLEVATKLALPR